MSCRFRHPGVPMIPLRATAAMPSSIRRLNKASHSLAQGATLTLGANPRERHSAIKAYAVPYPLGANRFTLKRWPASSHCRWMRRPEAAAKSSISAMEYL